MTSMAIATVSALFVRMKAMVSNQPLRKPRSASGLPAIALSVAKITWMWKSFTRSPKRIKNRAFAALLEIERLREIDHRRRSTALERGDPVGLVADRDAMPSEPQPCCREVSLTSQ